MTMDEAIDSREKQHMFWVKSLQHTATHCNTLQLTAIYDYWQGVWLAWKPAQVMSQITAIHCNTLQHTVTHYNALQYVTIGEAIDPRENEHRYVIWFFQVKSEFVIHVMDKWIVLSYYTYDYMYSCIYIVQHTATHCNTLLHTATHYNIWLMHVRNTVILERSKADSQCDTASRCNTLQWTAAHYSTLKHTTS